MSDANEKNSQKAEQENHQLTTLARKYFLRRLIDVEGAAFSLHTQSSIGLSDWRQSGRSVSKILTFSSVLGT